MGRVGDQSRRLRCEGCQPSRSGLTNLREGWQPSQRDSPALVLSVDCQRDSDADTMRGRETELSNTCLIGCIVSLVCHFESSVLTCPSNTIVTSLNIQISLKTSPASNLRLQFDKLGDRWSHRWQLVEPDGQATDVLTSVEGGAEDIFPASAAMQEINLHELPAGPAVLGVGMAGKGHWSASYSVEMHQDQPAVKCDLACLLKQLQTDGQWLGSTYLIRNDIAVEHEETQTRFSVNGQSFAMIADPDFASIKLAEQQIQIVPAKISDSKTVATRWLFSMTG